MIKANSVTKVVNTSEGSLQILRPISFEVKSGESVAVIGASGSGKSTLLGLLAGLDQVSEGEIFLDNEALHNMDEEERAVLRGNKVGFIFQSFMLVQSLTALENVMLPAEIAGLDNPKALAIDILEQVGLKHRAHHFPNQLSGGEQQRVSLARAFSNDPQILFADEPTGNLDEETGKKVEDLLFKCPCCDSYSLDSRIHDICPVCKWHDDGTTKLENVSGANWMTLQEGQDNLKKHGVSKLKYLDDNNVETIPLFSKYPVATEENQNAREI